MKNILITGANRGIGLALSQVFVEQEDTMVFAACRKPAEAARLQLLSEGHEGRLTIVELDVDEPTSIDRSVREIETKVDSIEVLINNAGVYGGSVAEPKPETSLFGSLAAEEMLEVFRTNSVSPVLVAQAYTHLLRKGVGSRIVNVSSDAGSITLREDKGAYAYMASKAALNMMTRCLAAELRDSRVIVVSMHPGFLRTDMGGPDAPMAIEETVPSLVSRIGRLSMEDSGRFINWDGEKIPW